MMEGFAEKNRIKELRLEKNISQRELAKRTGIKQANISRWEAGSVVPNVNDIWTIANFFDCSIDYISGRSDF
jgi:transcriptional regulator with XRE-family HTH domain